MEDDCKVGDGESLSTVNKLNGKKLKIGDSHDVASGNYGAESGSKEELESKWREEPCISER